jgi:hypothetical protein
MENGSNLLKKIKKITLITLFIIALYGVVCVPSIIVGYGAMVGFMLNPFIAPFIGILFWYFIIEATIFFKIILIKKRNKK